MSAAEFVPASADLEGLRRAAADCRGCQLYEKATQTVFSRGAVASRVVLVGEQPGDVEDRRGGAFFGAAGGGVGRGLGGGGGGAARADQTEGGEDLKFTEGGRGRRRGHPAPETP